MLSTDPYSRNLVNTGYYVERAWLQAQVVAVLQGHLDSRNLELIPQPSRAIKRGEVHELIVTEEEAAPGQKVQSIAYVAFVEFLDAGVLLRKDTVSIDKHHLGNLAGYDLSHFPNHMNIVIQGPRKSGKDRRLTVGMPVTFGKHSGPYNLGTGNEQ